MFLPRRCLVLFWLMLGSALSFLSGVTASECPFDYPFDSCPRPGDLSTDTLCCISGHRYSCCNKFLIQVWAVVLLVGACVLIIGAVVTIVCCCCGCCPRKKRREYTVIRDSITPQSNQLQPGVVVVTAPPSQYGYRTMGYPASTPMQPPSYMPQPVPYTPQHTAEVTTTDTVTEDGEAITHF